MGLLDLYRRPKPEPKQPEEEADDEKPEPLPRITMSELWPPSPRVKMLYIGVGFFLFNMTLLCIWAVVLANNAR